MTDCEVIGGEVSDVDGAIKELLDCMDDKVVLETAGEPVLTLEVELTLGEPFEEGRELDPFELKPGPEVEFVDGI